MVDNCNDRYYANIHILPKWWWMVYHCSITTWISSKSLTHVRVIPDSNTQACAHTDKHIDKLNGGANIMTIRYTGIRTYYLSISSGARSVWGYNNSGSFEMLKSETNPISDYKLLLLLLIRNYNCSTFNGAYWRNSCKRWMNLCQHFEKDIYVIAKLTWWHNV